MLASGDEGQGCVGDSMVMRPSHLKTAMVCKVEVESREGKARRYTNGFEGAA